MGAIVRSGDDWIEVSAGDALRGITLDCTAIPDAAMTLAVVALFARGPTTLTGIASWRVKETDRITAMAAELAKLGARVEAGADRLTVHPPERFTAATIDTYDDHRMAMCFSLAALGGIAIRINDPGCVRKTFPGYFDAFRSIVQSMSGTAAIPVDCHRWARGLGQGNHRGRGRAGTEVPPPRQRFSLPAGRAESAGIEHRSR